MLFVRRLLVPTQGWYALLGVPLCMCFMGMLDLGCFRRFTGRKLGKPGTANEHK